MKRCSYILSMGNAITAALREPARVALVEAVLPYDNLHVRDIEAYWRSFYDHATSFALSRAQLRVVCSKAARLLDAHASSARAMVNADHIFDIFAVRLTGQSQAMGSGPGSLVFGDVMDALEFLSAIVFISAVPIEDKIDLLFDSWDMSDDGALDMDELTISLKSSLLGLAKILKLSSQTASEKSAPFLDDDEIEVLAERVFREIAKISSATASVNQVTITCDQFRAYCMENKTARAIFDVFNRVEKAPPTEGQLDDDENEDDDESGLWRAMNTKGNIVGAVMESGGEANLAMNPSTLNDHGDEFLAVKPWIGAIVPPGKPPLLDKSAPVLSLALEWIFGYNAQDSKNNARYCPGTADDIVYPAAAACVVLNIRTNVQRHYLGHTDDVRCLCVHPKQPVVASGELGKAPKIHIWSAHTVETLCVLQGFHQRSILHVAFCGDATLVSVGGDDDHSVAVYETKDAWKTATLRAFAKGNKAVPFHLCANPSSTMTEFVCCGDKTIDFWSLDGKVLSHKRAVLGSKGTTQAFHVAEYIGNSNSLVVGANDGSLYAFVGRDLSSVVKSEGGGAVLALHYCSGTLVVGTKTGLVSLRDDKLKPIAGPFNIKDASGGLSNLYPAVSSCCLSPDKTAILVGTAASELLEIDPKTGKNARGDALATGHFGGETWGLDVHPHKAQCCTVGDDRTFRIWDLETKKELRSVSLELPARACAYSPDGKLIAVGLGADGGGSATARSSAKSTSRAKKPAGGFVVISEQDLARVKEPCYDAKKWVSDLKFSPDGRTLAVASHDTVVYFYDVLKGFSKKPGSFKKHTSYICHIDFSSDGLHLQSTCGGYELLFCEVQTARHITNASTLRDERWHTMTSTLGWAVQGIWAEGSDGTDVNAVDRSRDGAWLATGDDFGKVKIFRYPCAVEKASYMELHGHSSHVTKVKWSSDDKWLLSTGGNDRCLFVWRNSDATESARDLGEVSDRQSPSKTKGVTRREIAASTRAKESDPLDVIDDNVGDEFMAVKPWLGAIVPPSAAKTLKLCSSAPDAQLELNRVHGYQAMEAANNARYDAQGKVVYHAAALGIVYDKATQTQSFFKCHDDDIIALCTHPNGTTFATAQMGKKPKIYTWNSNAPTKFISCLEGFHQRGVPAICFSSDGKKLASVGADDDHSVAIYSWENGLLTASAKGERSTVRAICYHLDQWISCGDKHVRFWREQGKNLTSKKAIFGKAKHKDDTMPGVFECVVSFGSHAVVGASNGDLYVFQGGSNELSRIVRAHASNAYALYKTGSEELVSGGKDCTIMVWDASFSNTFKFDLKEHAPAMNILDAQIRSVCTGTRSSPRSFLVGTRGSDLVEVDASRPATLVSSMHTIARGHSQMEVWGLATHPSRPEYCSAGDDQTLRVWSVEKKCLLRHLELDTMARACAIFASGKMEVVAIGLGGRHAAAAARNAKVHAKSGCVVVVRYDELYNKLFEDKPSKQPISDVKFSPDGLAMAVGSHDHCIYLYRIQDPASFKKVTKTGVFAKHQSYVSHFDFSADGSFLQSNCGANELLFSNANTGKHITSATSTKDVTWDSWTCVLGWPVQGIWPPYSDGTDVNAVDRNHKSDLLATADDFGLVKLFRYPCVEKNSSSIDHRGHSSHVTNVRWCADDKYVVSAGGNDRCLLEWRVVRDDVEEQDPSRASVATTMSEIGEDDEDDSEDDMDEIDGDEFLAVKPWLGAIVAPSNASAPNSRVPDVHVELDWVYGYHTELSKQNLVYNSHGEIVYHTAAVGVIFDHKNHLQKHHLHHNDDILSFAMTASRDIVATGERGKRPVVRVWDAHTGELRSELKGFHTRGVVSLAFSQDALRLVTVGDDDDHSVAVWEDASHGSWKLVNLVAMSKGDKAANRFSCFGRDAATVVTGGVKHVLFWRIEGKTLVQKKGKVGKKGSLQVFPTGCFFGSDFVTGTAGGELYVWTGDDLSKVVKAHDGESTIVCCHETPTVLLMSGGKDGRVVLWNTTYQPLKTVDLGVLSTGCLNKAIASACLSSDSQRLLIGTWSSDILEVDMASGTVLHGGKPLCSGHFSLELWGLAVHPSTHQFVTTGDDGTLRVWDMDAKKLLAMTKLTTKARACAYSPDGTLLAVGFGGDNGVRRKAGKASSSKDGAIAALSAHDLSVRFEDRPAKEWISDIKFSPCGRLLAAGSHDNAIHFYAVTESSFKKRKPFAKHNSYVTHLDFSRDSKFVQSNCGAYELLFCDASSSDQVRFASSLKDTAWHTWTCPLGWPVQGIWPECADGTDINAVCASASRTMLATGDDSSRVKLFRFPCTMKGAKFLEARGHASHVTNVRFSFDDKFILSTGGNDRSIFQWKLS
jgi:echinoderm microtubule-associated protein-like 6